MLTGIILGLVILYMVFPIIPSLYYAPELLKECPGAYLRWIVCVPISMLFIALSFVVVPFLAALSVIFGWKNFPGFLDAFQTVDDDLDGGQHQLGWPEASGIDLFKQRTAWLWRNPADTFEAKYLGFDVTDIKEVRYVISEGVWDYSYDNQELVVVTNHRGRKAFQIRSQFFYEDEGKVGSKYFRMFIGWGLDHSEKPKVRLKQAVHPYKSSWR